MRAIILVTGASGKTGRAILAALSHRGAPTRALVRRQSQIDTAARIGAHEALVADMRLATDLRGALENARAVYHICPNVSPDEVQIGHNVIAAAREADVEHFVLHSVLHPQAEAMPHHWSKLRVEEALLQSGLKVTILQPAAYMQNLLSGWDLITEEGLLRSPYATQTRISLVDLVDVAEAAAKALLEPGHAGATYELTGTPPLTQVEVAGILGDALGRPVRAEAEPVEAWERRAVDAGLGEYQRATLIKMFRYYEQYGLAGNSNVLSWLLERQPTSLAQFARRAAQAHEVHIGDSGAG